MTSPLMKATTTDYVKARSLFLKCLYSDAQDIIEGYLKRNKKDCNAWSLLGDICKRRKDFKGAEQAFRHASNLLPKDQDVFVDYIYCSLRSGTTSPAMITKKLKKFREPLRLESSNFIKGVTYFLNGNINEAIKHYIQSYMIKPCKLYAENIANACLHLDDWKNAEDWWVKCIEDDESDQFYWDRLAKSYALQDKWEHTFVVYKKLTSENPENSRFLVNFAFIMAQMKFSKYSGAYRDAILYILKQNNVLHQEIFYNWVSLLERGPEFQIFRSLISSKNDEEWQSCWDNSKMTFLQDDFFVFGIRRLRSANAYLEDFLTRLRHQMLSEVVLKKENINRSFFPFLSALSQHCFLNEYLFEETSEELQLLDDLKEAMGTYDGDDFIGSALILSCYRQLSLEDVPQDNMNTVKDDPFFHSVWTYHYIEFEREKEIASKIESFSSIDDNVSKEVKDMYEENPYPRWVSSTIFKDESKDLNHQKRSNILIAGCGTGQQVQYIRGQYPYSKITAFDLSYRSLSYAIRKMEEAGYDDIQFYQGDILNVNLLNKKFDHIECTGVLHHMEDPMAGWRALASCLKLNGTMKIGLYSEVARRHIVEAREIVTKQNFTSDLQGIREFRSFVRALPEGDSLRKCMDNGDYYTVSTCRDLVFHVQEHRYTIPQLKECFGALNLEFNGFIIRNPKIGQKYTAIFPEDREMKNLDNWYIFEKENPDSFMGMYQFEVIKRG